MATIVEDQAAANAAAQVHAGPGKIPAYAWFSLFVLTLANVLNHIDRQIPSILAQSIKADYKLDDAQLGFLMGTAFAVFYSVIGIAMGRISDGVSRKKLMAFGLALWSTMTALGGVATSFAGLSMARIGVGVGEATANPCSHSLLADSFPPRNRAASLSIYLAGTFIGSALAMIVGGTFLQHWANFCGAVPLAGACSIAGWKAALIAVGLPGIPLAVLLLAMREPPRAHRRSEPIARLVAREFTASIPPLTLFALHRVGGVPALTRNLFIAALIAAGATALALLTGDTAQWAATGLGAYAIFTWGNVQKYRDRPLYSLTFGCPTFVLAMGGSAMIACIGGGVSVWAAPYAMRMLHLSPLEAGLSLGLLSASGAPIGLILGGWLTDQWKRRDPRAPIGMAAISLLGGLPCLTVMMLTQDKSIFLGAYFCFAIASSLWSGAFAALVQDLVLPRMRGAAAAAFSLVSIVIASGAGPYWAGKVSTVTGSLRAGMLSTELLLPLALILLWLASRRLRTTTPQSRRAQAEAAGEPALASVAQAT